MEIDICPDWLLSKLGIPPEAKPHAGLLVSIVVVVMALPALKVIPHFCLAQKVLHIPCPGCGVLHAMAALSVLDFSRAWQANPAAIAMASVFAFNLFARPVAIAIPNTRSSVTAISRWSSAVVLWSLCSVWILRVIHGTN